MSTTSSIDICQMVPLCATNTLDQGFPTGGIPHWGNFRVSRGN